MINKYENISVGTPGWKLSGWLNDNECIVLGEEEDSVKKEVTFDCYTFFCVSLYTTLGCHDSLHVGPNFMHLCMKWPAVN